MQKLVRALRANRSYFVLGATSIALVSGCTSQSDSTSHIAIQLPSSSLAMSALSASAYCGGTWGLCAPTAMSAIKCYAIAVEYQAPSAVRTCKTTTGGVVLQPRLIFGAQAPSSLMLIDLPPGPARKISLIGIDSDSGACPDLSGASQVDRSHFSAPLILGSVTADLVPGDASLDLAATATNATSFDDCAWATGSSSLALLYAWGDNSNSAFGAPSVTTSVPLPMGGLRFSSLTAGATHSCGLVGQTAYCWGSNSSGQLGTGTNTNSATPIPVSGNRSFRSINAGNSYTCAIDINGLAYCWGINNLGQLGIGSTTAQTQPVLVGTRKWQKLTTGPTSACGIEDGTHKVYCWGDNTHAQLAVTAGGYSFSPSAVDSTLTYSDVSMGDGHACGVTTDGFARCWGSNSNNQLGLISPTTDTSLVIAVGGVDRYLAISASSATTCAITVGGAVQCWGGGLNGELGNGTLSVSSMPSVVSNLSDVRSISTSGHNACAVTGSADLFCWGSNAQMLGVASVASARSTPIKVDAGTKALAVTLGSSHVLALRSL